MQRTLQVHSIIIIIAKDRQTKSFCYNSLGNFLYKLETDSAYLLHVITMIGAANAISLRNRIHIGRKTPVYYRNAIGTCTVSIRIERYNRNCCDLKLSSLLLAAQNISSIPREHQTPTRFQAFLYRNNLRSFVSLLPIIIR